MLQLRAFATPERVATAGEELRVIDGVRHVLIGRNTIDGAAMITGDGESESADRVLNILRDLGFGREDVTLWRATSIQPLVPHGRIERSASPSGIRVSPGWPSSR